MEEKDQIQPQAKFSSPAEPNPYAIPISIIVAGLLISGTVYFTRAGGPVQAPKNGGTAAVSDQLSGSPAAENVRPVSSSDHMLGNPDAPVKIIEFSDLECPFCKRFHPTLEDIISEYDGQVAWVWRHFPLTSLHPKAVKSAEATECAYEQGGNDAFWKYVEKYYEVTPSNNNIDLSSLPIIAQEIGLNRQAFESCLSSNRYENKVKEQFEEAINAGGNGTPYSVVVAKNGTTYQIFGAQPYEQVKATIEQALDNL